MIYNQDTFMALRLRVIAAEKAESEYVYHLKCKYGESWYMIKCNKTETKKREALQLKTEKATEAFFTMLDKISPRNWRQGVSAYWVIHHLYYADAITHGKLSEIPMAAYGYTQADTLRFCQPVEQLQTV